MNLNRRRIAAKANAEWGRLTGFDLMYREDYKNGTIDLAKLISRNYDWLLDHANDSERGLRAHMKRELDAEDETAEEHIRRVSSDLLPTPGHKP